MASENKNFNCNAFFKKKNFKNLSIKPNEEQLNSKEPIYQTTTTKVKSNFSIIFGVKTSMCENILS